jgi:hypothetical protein
MKKLRAEIYWILTKKTDLPCTVLDSRCNWTVWQEWFNVTVLATIVLFGVWIMQGSFIILSLSSIFRQIILFFYHVQLCPLPSWFWPKCNRLLRLGRPWGAVTLPRWCEWWYIWAWGARRGLKPKVYKLPGPRPPWRSSPIRENSHGRTGNRTRDLMSSQESWPPGHEAGPMCKYIVTCM